MGGSSYGSRNPSDLAIVKMPFTTPGTFGLSKATSGT
jgi:hypothetical protein